eukprot:gene7056-11219_t
MPTNRNLKGQTIFITGASRGIGLAIAIECAKDGANVCIAAKTADKHPKLEGTIFTAAKQIEEAGGKALPVQCDIRSEEQVKEAIKKCVDTFGGIDICINNASAIHLKGVEDIDMKRFDLMHAVNARGTFLVSKLCLPYLKKSQNPHILMLSPPLEMEPKWFKNHTAYTMAKYGMSMCVLGMSEEFKPYNIAVNALWPLTSVATAAVQNILGGDYAMKKSRKPSIMSKSAYIILTRDSSTCTGNIFIDELVLEEEGETNWDQYANVPGIKLMPDLFINDKLMSRL